MYALISFKAYTSTATPPSTKPTTPTPTAHPPCALNRATDPLVAPLLDAAGALV